ncbi:hypothetical protein ACWGCW_00440 [Streptomyces sp. NPDC054933]
MTMVPVPIPGRIAGLIGSQIPPHVMQAVTDAEGASVTVHRCRTEWTREARELALADLARANKTLAAYSPYSPKLVLRPGGVR